MGDYLSDVLAKARSLRVLDTKRSIRHGTQNPTLSPNDARKTNLGFETGNLQQHSVDSKLKSMYNQAKGYDPYSKTKEDSLTPLTYLQSESTAFNDKLKDLTNKRNTSQYEYDTIRKKYMEESAAGLTSTPRKVFGRTIPARTITIDMYNKALQNRDQSQRLLTSFSEHTQSKKNLIDLIRDQSTFLGKDNSNVDVDKLAAADWSSFEGLKADVEKYEGLKQTYMDKKLSNKDGNKIQFYNDWIKQYDNLISDTYTAMKAEIPKVIANSVRSYDTSMRIKEDRLGAIETLLAPEKAVRRVTDVDIDYTKEHIANRIDRVNEYRAKKPMPVFNNRPS